MSHYVPKPDLEGINTTEKHEPIKDFIILLSGFLFFLVIAYATLGAVGEWIFTRISIEQELKIIGPIWKKRVLSAQIPNELLIINQNLNTRLGHPIQIEISCDKSPNAFALPGGRILLTKGLFENIKSENGLMFVIGHEIGHVMNRDHMRGFGRSLILAIFNSMIGINADTDAGLNMMNNVFARSYNQKQEIAADDYGLAMTKEIYGHTKGAEEFFESLQSKETSVERSIVRFLNTHPLSSERAEKIKLSSAGVTENIVTPSRPFADWIKDSCSSKK